MLCMTRSPLFSQRHPPVAQLRHDSLIKKPDGENRRAFFV
jgi:hypothetical protein